MSSFFSNKKRLRTFRGLENVICDERCRIYALLQLYFNPLSPRNSGRFADLKLENMYKHFPQSAERRSSPVFRLRFGTLYETTASPSTRIRGYTILRRTPHQGTARRSSSCEKRATSYPEVRELHTTPTARFLYTLNFLCSKLLRKN